MNSKPVPANFRRRALLRQSSHAFAERIILAAMICVLFTKTAEAQRLDVQWPKIFIPNGIQEVSGELIDGVPFSLDSSYSLKDDVNREQAYLRLFVEYYAHQGVRDGRRIEEAYPTGTRFYESRDFRRGFTLRRKHQNQLNELFRNELAGILQNGVPAKDRKRIEKLVAVFDPVFEGLKETQRQCEDCFFHRSSFAWGKVTAPAGFFTELLQLRYTLSPKGNRPIEELSVILELLEDSRIMGGQHVQEQCRRNENDCFRIVVRRLLRSGNQTAAELDQLIEILRKHRESRMSNDPVVQQARHEYLLSRQVFLLLRDGRYMDGLKNISKGVIMNDADAIQRLLQEMSYANGVMEVVASRELAKRWEDSQRPKREVDWVREFAKKTEKHGNTYGAEGSDIRRSVELEFISEMMKAATKADFENDIRLLAKRYSEIDAACRMPYPESTNQLRKLAIHWNADGNGSASGMLLACYPQSLPSRAQSMLQVNAYLCLAAIKKWRMEHNGDNPDNLESALAAIGFDEPLLDPYSGKSLQMKLNGALAKVYSVGFDGKDQNAKATSEPVIGKNELYRPVLTGLVDLPAGDIVFMVKFR